MISVTRMPGYGLLCLFATALTASCVCAQQPVLSSLQATKGHPLYTTYAAATQRSSFVLDQGYEFQYDKDSLGADFITDTGGDWALGFKLGDQWVYRVEDMHSPPYITSSYPDMVRYTYYPFEGVRVNAWFVVHSSTQALLDINIVNERGEPVRLEVYPFLRHRSRSFEHAVSGENYFSFEHQEYPDAWTLSHDLPYTDSIRNVFMVSRLPEARGAFTSEYGETFAVPNEVELSQRAVKQVNGRVYLPGKRRLPEANNRVRLQMFVDDSFDALLTNHSPVWGGTHSAIDIGGYFRLESAMLNPKAKVYTVYAHDAGTGWFGRVSGELEDGHKRHDLDLDTNVRLPSIHKVRIEKLAPEKVRLAWTAGKHRSFSLYRRQYPTPHYTRIAASVTDSFYVDMDIHSRGIYGYLVVPSGPDGELGMHAPEVNTIVGTSFQEFVEKGPRYEGVEQTTHSKILAFKHIFALAAGDETDLRILRAVAPIRSAASDVIQSAESLLDTPLDVYQKDNEEFFANTPPPPFDDEEKTALYWSAANMMRQVFYPPEAKSSYNYYVFSREPTWGWGHGGQVFHESIAMLAYVDIDPVGAMNSQRVYLERQYPNGYINYRTGSYLDEVIEHNGQLTTSAPWYAWLNWEIYKKTQDRSFLEDMYSSSAKLFRFIVANRDADADGLCEWGGHAVLESVRDALVAVWDEVGFPTNFESLDLNCMLVMEAKSLEQMALALGLVDEATGWRKDYEQRTRLINETFWDDQNGFYYQVDKHTHTFSHKTANDLKRDEIIGFLPLWAGVADETQARRLLENLTDTAKFWRPYGVPTLSAQDSYYNDKGYWNGPVWAQWNCLIMRGLQDYGYHAEARELVDRVAAGMIAVLKDTHNLWEFYSPDEAWGGYHKTYIWSGIINRMMIDVTGKENE